MYYFILIVTFVVVLVSLYHFVPKSTVSSLVGASTEETTTTSGYVLYNHYFVTGVKPGGKMISINSNCRTALQCSNIFALEDNVRAASWNSQTKTCICYADTEPITENPLYTTIVPMPSETSNNVSQWTSSEVQTITGDIICSQIFSNSEYAAAVCSATPGCGGYTYEFDANNSDKPIGCLKLNSGIIPTSRNVRLFTGTRTDAAPIMPNVRYDTITTGGSPAVIVNNVTLRECSDTMVRLSPNYMYATYNNNIKACNIYPPESGLPPISTAKNNFMLFGTGALMPDKYANTWVSNVNTDYQGNSTDTPGFGTRLKLTDAILNCTNTTSCKAIAIDTATGLTYFRSSLNPVPNSTTFTSYVPPTSL